MGSVRSNASSSPFGHGHSLSGAALRPQSWRPCGGCGCPCWTPAAWRRPHEPPPRRTSRCAGVRRDVDLCPPGPHPPPIFCPHLVTIVHSPNATPISSRFGEWDWAKYVLSQWLLCIVYTKHICNVCRCEHIYFYTPMLWFILNPELQCPCQTMGCGGVW